MRLALLILPPVLGMAQHAMKVLYVSELIAIISGIMALVWLMSVIPKHFNVCVTSNANTSNANSWGAQINGATVEAWFDGYAGDGNMTTEIGTSSTGTIHYRDCFPIPTNEGGTGTVDQDFS